MKKKPKKSKLEKDIIKFEKWQKEFAKENKKNKGDNTCWG